MIDLEELTKDVKAAYEAGLKAAVLAPEGGSENFDALAIPFGLDHPIKRRSGRVAAAIADATGSAPRPVKTRLWNHYLISFPLGASKNTAACQAAVALLKKYDATVFYQLD